MAKIGFKGLVRLANSVRKQLAGPISPVQLANVQETAADAIATVRSTLEKRKSEARHHISRQKSG